MREVSGTTWTFQLIILFILIFACFLTLVLNYNKAYSVKNELLTIIEKYEGVNEESLDIMNNYLRSTGYKTKGKCSSENEHDTIFGVLTLDGQYEKANSSNYYYYCFQENDSNNLVYYNVTVFYRFNLPVLGEIATFRVNGRTNTFKGSNDRF